MLIARLFMNNEFLRADPRLHAAPDNTWGCCQSRKFFACRSQALRLDPEPLAPKTVNFLLTAQAGYLLTNDHQHFVNNPHGHCYDTIFHC